MTETIIDLRNVHFSEAETTLASFGGLTASVWRYRGGVAALRLERHDIRPVHPALMK